MQRNRRPEKISAKIPDKISDPISSKNWDNSQDKSPAPDLLDRWHRAKISFRRKLISKDYAQWIEGISVEDYEDTKGATAFRIVIKSDNSYRMKWVVDKYGDLIMEVFMAELAKYNCPSGKVTITGEYRNQKQRESQTTKRPTIKKHSFTSYIDPRQNLDNFISCDTNILAKQLAADVIEDSLRVTSEGSHQQDDEDQYKDQNIDQSRGPWFIYGSSGIGKTHLLHAIVNGIRKKNNSKNLVYVTADHFLHCVVESIKNKKIEELKDFYAKADVLLLDDLHFLDNKKKTQTELLAIFKILAEKNIPMIFAADKAPQRMSELSSQLRSRLSRSLVAGIARPAIEARTEVLLLYAEKFGCKMDDDCARYVATKITRSFRHLEGAVKNIAFSAQTLKQKVDMELIKDVLKNFAALPNEKLEMAQIIKETAKFYGVSIMDIESNKRSHNISLSRQVAMFLCRELTDHSTTEIGKVFGGKGHSTVLYSCTSIAERLRKDKKGELPTHLNKIQTKLLSS